MRASRSSPASLSSLWSRARGAAATLLVALSTVPAAVPAAALSAALSTACAWRGAASAGDELRELAQFLDEVHPRPHAIVEAAALAALAALVDDEARHLDAPLEDEGDPSLARANQLAFGLAYGLRPSYALDVRLPDGELRRLSLAGIERDTLAALATARRRASITGALFIGEESGSESRGHAAFLAGRDPYLDAVAQLRRCRWRFGSASALLRFGFGFGFGAPFFDDTALRG